MENYLLIKALEKLIEAGVGVQAAHKLVRSAGGLGLETNEISWRIDELIDRINRMMEPK